MRGSIGDMPQTTEDRPFTPAQRLAVTLYALHSETEQKLDDDVAAWLAAGNSWRKIAKDIATVTNGEVSVSYESLRTWYGHLKTEAVA